MNGNYNNLKEKMINSNLQEKLTFTKEDRENVFASLNQNKSKESNNHLKRLFPKVVIPALTATFLMVGSAILLNHVINSSNEALTNKDSNLTSGNGDIDHTSSMLNEAITENGISVTVNNVLFDGKFIFLHYTAKSDSKTVTGENIDPGNLKIKVNGEEKTFKLEGYGDHTLLPNEEEIIAQLKPKGILPDTFQLDASFQKIGQTEGDWEFSLPVAKSDHLVQKFKPNVSSTYAKTNTKMSVKEVIFSPTETKIYTSVKNPIYHTDIVQEMITGESETRMMYEVVNEFNEVIPVYHTLSDNYSPILTIAPTRDLENLPESLTLKTIVMRTWGDSYDGKPHELEESAPLSTTTPFLVEQEKDAGIRIQKVERKQGEIWIHYDIEGNLPLYRNSIYLMVGDGETTINPTNYGDMNYYQRSHIAKFKIEEPIENIRVGTFATDYREIKELEVKIPIK